MSVTTAPGGVLDKNAFLQLLVAQMQYQDPMQPQDSTAFVAELAQFSALEQMMNLVQEVQTEVTAATASYETQLIGRSVQVSGSDGNVVTGVVSGVRWVNGQPMLVIGGQTYNMTDLISVLNTQDANTPEG
jgi:flagellar basal-body rod modification protein FlgD